MDLIDRGALKANFDDIMVQGVVDTNGGITPMVEYRAVVELIDWMPTEDAQPVKHGHWIECDSQPNQKMCSSCRGVGVAKDIAQFFTYCPFCGADMRGDKDGR